MQQRFIRLGLVFALAIAATGAAAQTSTSGSSGGTPASGPGGQLLSEGFFGASSGGVGSGAVGSPINTNTPATGSLGFFGPGALWSADKPAVGSPMGNTPGVELVSAAANGSSNASAPAGGAGATTATPSKPQVSLGGVGPRRFLTPG